MLVGALTQSVLLCVDFALFLHVMSYIDIRFSAFINKGR